MTRTLWALLGCAVLVGCGVSSGGSDGQDIVQGTAGCPASTPIQSCTVEEDTTTPDPTATPMDDLTQNVQTVSFSQDGSTIDVTFVPTSTAATPVATQFTRNPALDVPGYNAYSQQTNALDRFFLALAAEGPANTVSGAIVGDGGQFNEVLQGGYFARSGAYDPPPITPATSQGQVSYAGAYGGITNIGSTAGSALLPVAPGAASLPNLPSQPAAVRGTVFINANFGNGSVNGEVFDRVLINPVDGSVAQTLTDLSLLIGAIDANGEFTGGAEVTGAVGVGVGTYGGIFGGPGASHVAGLVELQNHIDGIENELEIGLFVLTQCGQPGAAAVCGSR